MANPDGINNPGGVNQFGGWPTQLPWGDKARQAALERLAPVPEPPDRPFRFRPTAQRTAAPAPLPPVLVAPPVMAAPPPPTYADIAAIDGASPLVQQVFGGNQNPVGS